MAEGGMYGFPGYAAATGSGSGGSYLSASHGGLVNYQSAQQQHQQQSLSSSSYSPHSPGLRQPPATSVKLERSPDSQGGGSSAGSSTGSSGRPLTDAGSPGPDYQRLARPPPPIAPPPPSAFYAAGYPEDVISMYASPGIMEPQPPPHMSHQHWMMSHSARRHYVTSPLPGHVTNDVITDGLHAGAFAPRLV